MPLKPRRLVQYQPRMAAVLTALAAPALMGVYNFGWRVLAVVAVSNVCCFAGEWWFVRRDGRPVTLSAFVTGTIFALILPPNVPFWMVVVGALFAIVFGKMVFGGFGRNIFNPAMVGRCLLYVAFPLFLTGRWFAPIDGPGGGFVRWTARAESEPVHELSAPEGVDVEGVSSATTLTAAKKLGGAAKAARAKSDEPQVRAARRAFEGIDLGKLLWGRISGSQGETSGILILLGLAYLLYRRAAAWQLVVSPLVGMGLGLVLLRAGGASLLPLGQAALVNVLGGGTLFAVVFMTTEPVSAPRHKTAQWLYGILIGLFASVIRTLSVFNAGLMFSVLLGNMFGPILEVGCRRFDDWRAGRGGRA